MKEFKDLIRRSRYFRFIGEQSWYQPIPTKDNSFEIFIDSSIERGSRIYGFLRPYKGRYLHTDIEIFLAEQIQEDEILSTEESDNTDPNIRDQARAFSNQIEKVIVQYMKEAINSDRTTVYNAIMDAGHPELAKLIRRL